MKIYLDNAATTRVHPKVFEKMKSYLSEDFGNPSSIHSFGIKARVAIEESREYIANFINADPSEIYFTSCGTEATNMIINGIARTEHKESGKNGIITTAGDHKASLLCVEKLEEFGFEKQILPINKNFEIDENKLKNLDLSNMALSSIIHINNETGTISNIKEIRKTVNNIYLHIDAVQSFGKIPLNVKDLDIDALSASAHKLYGPKGIGFAYIRSGTPMESLIIGGGQERNRRAGTENVASIAGFAEAVKLAKEGEDDNFSHAMKLKKYFLDGLKSLSIEGINENTSSNISPYILSITFDPNMYNNDSEAQLMYLDLKGIAVSSGSACASGTLKPSHVILAAGHPEEYAKGTIRISFSIGTTFEELDYSLGVFKEFADNFRK